MVGPSELRPVDHCPWIQRVSGKTKRAVLCPGGSWNTSTGDEARARKWPTEQHITHGRTNDGASEHGINGRVSAEPKG